MSMADLNRVFIYFFFFSTNLCGYRGSQALNVAFDNGTVLLLYYKICLVVCVVYHSLFCFIYKDAFVPYKCTAA